MNICYWNLHKNKETQSDKFNEFLSTMLIEKSVDLFCVSEFDKFNEQILFDNHYFLIDEVNCDKVKCYKKEGLSFTQIRIDSRFVVVEQKGSKMLLICVHSPDAENYDEKKRIHFMEEIKLVIDDYIKINGETKVIILGDFNCMPYDDSFIDEDVFNCVLYRDLLKTKAGAKERYYNPMLLLLSESQKIYGSFYSDSIKDKNLRWYILDQIMVNKFADKFIDYESISLVKQINNICLLKNGKPDSTIYSDHLPLYFEILEEEYE